MSCLMELIGGPYDGQIRTVDCHYAPQTYVFEDFDYTPPQRAVYSLSPNKPSKIQRVKGRGFMTVYRYEYVAGVTDLPNS